MKQLQLLLLCVIALSSCTAQKVTYQWKENAYVIEKKQRPQDVLTGATCIYNDVRYPIWMTANKKLYIIVTSKTGNKYRKYLKINSL